MIKLILKNILPIFLIFIIVLSSTTAGLSSSLSNVGIESDDPTRISGIDNARPVEMTEVPGSSNIRSNGIEDLIDPENAQDSIPIILRTNKFVPFESEPVVPELFRSNNLVLKNQDDSKQLYLFDENAEDYFIIQFGGPVEWQWKRAILAMGIELYDYIPDYAFIAYGDLKLIPSIQALDFVHWIGPFHSYYRVQPELMDMIMNGFCDPSLFDQRIMISLRPIDDMNTLLSAVNFVGGQIRVIDADQYVACDLTLGMAFQLVFTKNLLWMELHSLPELFNNQCSKILDIRQVNNGTFANDGNSLWSYNHNTGEFEGFPGNDVIIAMADSGVDGTHPAFDGKKIWFKNYGTGAEDTWTDSGTASGHGTHTSGTALGNGAWRSGDSGEAGKYAGMAPAADLIGQAIFQGGTVTAPNTICNDAAAHGADISSNSWGWPGTAGNYDNTAVSYDGLVRNSAGKEFIIVFGTGNEGPGTIRSPSTAKNVISVGATDNNAGTSVTGFSSGGPTDDDRTKPDVVAPGQLVASCGWRDLGYGKPTDGQNSYFYATGTSMATPAAGGATAVVVDFINHTYGYVPSPALVKALLVNGAVPIDGYTYPGNRQGWGRINLANSLLETPQKRFYIVNQNISLETKDDQMYFFNVKTADSPLRITLTWTDEPGSPGSGKNLVNDLDLILEGPEGNTYYGNYFQNGKSASGGEADEINNVEGIYIPSAPVGGYILTIYASNVPTGPQDFALVLTADFHDLSKGIRDIEVLPSLEFEDKIHLEGDTITLNGSFKNSGTIPTINVKYRIVHIRPDLVEENFVDITLPLLEVDQVHYVEYKWSAVRGFHTFKLIADPFDKLREEDENNNRAENSINIDHFGIETFIMEDRKVTLPDDDTSFSINILNTGSLADTYDAIYSTPPPDWVAELDFEAVSIGSNESRTISFSVTPPVYALANETIELSVTIISRGNSTYTNIVKTITIVEQYFEFKLQFETLRKEIKPGVKGQYNITINNTGNGPDSFAVGTTGGKYGWNWDISHEFIDIPARETRNITMNVTPPADGMAGEFSEIQIFVVDLLKLSREIKITSVVAEVFLFDLDIEPATVAMNPGGKARYPMTAFNRGNVEDNYRFTFKLPRGWEANFTKNDFEITATEFSRFYLNVKVPAREMPDIYIVNVTMKSLSTGWTKEYVIELEINQHFEIEAEIININNEVYQGQKSEYELKITNYGTGTDSVKIEEISIPQYWRMKIDNNVLGLNMNGTNTTKITLVTDILSEDKIYESLIRVTSAGNDSVSLTRKITTDVDSSRSDGGRVDSDDNGTAEDNGIFGQGKNFDIMMIIAIIIVIAIITLFALLRRKKVQKIFSEEEEERRKLEEEKKEFEDTYKDLYGKDIVPSRREVRSFGYVEGPPGLQGRFGGPAQTSVPIEYIAPPGPSPSPKPLLPPRVQHQGYGRGPLPLGPLPEPDDTAGESRQKKKKLKKARSPEGAPGSGFTRDESALGLSVKLPGEQKGFGQYDFDVSLPERPQDRSPDSGFEPLKPERRERVIFEQKKPEFRDGSPLEWESVPSEEYQKQFEFGSSPKTVDPKKKK